MKKEERTQLHSEVPFFSVCYESVVQRELFERHFKLLKVLSGHMLFMARNRTLAINAGHYAFVTPGGFSKIRMYPAKNGPFRLLGLNFSDKFITDYSRRNVPTVHIASSRTFSCFEKVSSEAWIEALFASLLHYILEKDLPDNELIQMKQAECMHIFQQRYPDLFSALLAGNLSKRVDLETFINENYMYNAPLERFAELSGRSLSTFRRECMARFGMPPNKLILEKRLEMAYEKLSHDDVRPSDIYWELGFETLAHFSRRFKDKYGIPPSCVKKDNV